MAALWEAGGGERCAGFDSFVQKRWCIHQMTEGALLLKWEVDGLHLKHFALDKTHQHISWERPAADDGTSESSARGSLELSKIVEISTPEAFSPSKKSAKMRNLRSFSLISTDEIVDIVAPTQRDFDIWYDGMVFLTGLTNKVLRGTGSSTEPPAECDADADAQTQGVAELARFTEDSRGRPNGTPDSFLPASEAVDTPAAAVDPRMAVAGGPHALDARNGPTKRTLVHTLKARLDQQRELMERLVCEREALLRGGARADGTSATIVNETRPGADACVDTDSQRTNQDFQNLASLNMMQQAENAKLHQRCYMLSQLLKAKDMKITSLVNLLSSST